MNRNICFNCGGELIERKGRTVCAYCGTYMPKNISNEETILLTSACQKLRLADFSEAEQEFDDLIRRHPNNAQAYWGRLLARYGIKYEEDYDGSRIPTCYAASIESVCESSDYKKAIDYADEENSAVFRRHAAYIERVRKEWVEKAIKEPPYDIFISYKDSDGENGLARTDDSFAMQELYFHLKERGYRVFFSRESLRDKEGEKYEPYIYNALSTAKIMLVYGSRPEYIRATWVKNEWTRYLKRMREGKKKQGSLLVVYKGFKPSELPGALSALQGFDAGSQLFSTLLFSRIEELLADTPSVEKHEKADAENGAVCHHVPIVIPAQAPTCTKPGWTESSHCEKCGTVLKEVRIIPATGHSFGDWRVAKKATCTEDGLYERVCRCGEKEMRPILCHGHVTSGEWETVEAPAPGKEGRRAKLCIRCGAYVDQDVIPSLPIRKASQGLRYKVNEDGKTCTIKGRGTCTDTDLVIPDTIDGYRVTAVGSDKKHRFGLVVSNFEAQLTSVVIPDSVTSIGKCAFSDCRNLTSAVIPPSVTSIEAWAFAGCRRLTSLTLPDSVTTIGTKAFEDCVSLTDLVIPDSVTRIGDRALNGVGAVSVSQDHAKYRSIDGNLYTKDGKTLLHYAANKKAPSFSVPHSVTRIGNGAFCGCGDLESIVIPDSVTGIGERAFEGCERLTDAVIPNAVTTIENGLFFGCKSLVSVRLPSAATGIGAFAFYRCASLTEAVIPDTVTEIGERAFVDCGKLREVVIPHSVTSIGNECFSGCRSLKNIRYLGSAAQWKTVTLGDEWKKSSSIHVITCTDGKIRFWLK